MKVWEAALATSSAPFYFRKFEKFETKKNYADGALHANFPVQYTLEEIDRVWKIPGEHKTPLDILLTVGTGQQNREIVIPVPLRIGGFEAVCTSFHNNLDSHRQWLEFKRVYLDDKQLKSKVHRLNAPIEGDYVALDHYKRMHDIDMNIGVQAQKPEVSSMIEDLARRLIAKLFFFEPSSSYRDNRSLASRQNEHIKGTIRCRLARESTPLKNLVDVIDSFWYREVHTEAELITENDRWKQIPLLDQQRSRVRTQREWLRVECTIAPVDSLETLQIIGVSLRRSKVADGPISITAPIPISGFPIDWKKLQHRSKRQ